jgi:aspartate/methionine/tyrosine aminotransferase
MNPNVTAIPPSLIRALNGLKRAGDLDLGLGEPTLRPAMEPFEAATRWVREHGCPYSPNAGFMVLREEIAAYAGAPDGPAGVCVTVGSEEALYLAIKTVVDPSRDEVLIVEPCYLAYAKLCMMEGIRHRTVALDAESGFAPDAERVLAALRPDTRLVVLGTPANPTGRVWPREELEKLAGGLLEREGAPVFVLADEVYRELYYTPDPPPSMLGLYPHALVTSSLSKSHALTGLRLGWLLGPREVVAEAIKAHQFVTTAACTFSQRVALEVFRGPRPMGVQRPHYQTTRVHLLRMLGEAGIEHLPPQGTFYAMVRLPARVGASLPAAERLLDQTRVLTVPGVAFGPSGEGWLRISWVASEAVLEEAVVRIARFFERVRETG